MKKLLTLIISAAIMLSFNGCGDFGEAEKSDTGITELEFFSLESPFELKVGQSQNGWFTVKGNKGFSVDDIEFISSDESVATFEYDRTELTTLVYYNLTAVSPGETIIYAQTKDGIIKTEEITVVISEL